MNAVGRELARVIPVAALTTVIAIVALALPMSVALLPDFGAVGLLFLLIFPALVLSLTAVGAFLALRVSSNPIGWLLMISGVAITVSTFGGTYVLFDHDIAGGSLPLVVPIAWLASWLTVPAIAVLAIYVPMLFPTGRFLSRRWRTLGLVSLAPAAIATADAFQPGPLQSAAWIQNPLGITGGEGLVNAAILIGNIPAPFIFGAAILSVVIRYRRAGSLERHQLKWFGFVAGVAIIALALSIPNDGPVSDAGWMVGLGALVFLPVAIGIAILRYHLYDIDRIISRTLSYAAVTALLAVLFAVLDLGSQEVLAPFVSGNGLAVAVSTLAVAASFQPIRRRVQAVVDRRFDRARYDADRVVTAFAARLRGDVELDALIAGIDETTRRTVAPASTSVWLRRAGGSRGMS